MHLSRRREGLARADVPVGVGFREGGLGVAALQAACRDGRGGRRAGRAVIGLAVDRRRHRQVGLSDHARRHRSVGIAVIQPIVAVGHRQRRRGQSLARAHVPVAIGFRPGRRGVAALDVAHGDGGMRCGAGRAVVELGVGGGRHRQIGRVDRHRTAPTAQRVVGRR